MLHPGTLIAAGALDLWVGPGASAALDGAAAAAAPALGFLRAAWFEAAAEQGMLATLVARRPAGGGAIAALPLLSRKIGPLTIREVAGSYWPYRSVPLALDAGDDELDTLLSAPESRAALGRAWRIGPVYADDPAATRLDAAARRNGWQVIRRVRGTCFMVDLASLTAAGPWPSGKTLRKNRWLERKLAESGDLEYRQVGGSGWTGEAFDTLAAIEAESWQGRADAGKDTKFLSPANRHIWECAVADPLLAGDLGANILTVGGTPAAFTFTLRAGDTLHVIANSYSERFAAQSPGRVLLYRAFQQAAEAGVRTIGWGAGDPGYKSEMGARPGPEILDLLFVRGKPLAMLANRFWR